MSSTMKCLVTGGAGFIGSHIAEGLVRKGFRVRIFDNLSTGNVAMFNSIRKEIDFVQGDLREPRDIQRAVKDVDVIFHQAALRSVPRSVDDPTSTNDVNISGTLNLLMGARDAKVKRVVYASSSSVYGDNRIYPQHEEIKPSPLSPYALSKLTGELYGIVFTKTFGLETVSLRYFNVFGPRQTAESMYAVVIPKFMQSALRNEPLVVHWDGKQSRDFTYIDNVVHGNILAALKPGIGGQVFNLACGDNYSLLDIIRLIEKFSGKKLQRTHTPMRLGDVRKTWADVRKAKKILKFKTQVGFEEGMRRTWDWFRANHQG